MTGEKSEGIIYGKGQAHSARHEIDLSRTFESGKSNSFWGKSMLSILMMLSLGSMNANASWGSDGTFYLRGTSKYCNMGEQAFRLAEAYPNAPDALKKANEEEGQIFRQHCFFDSATRDYTYYPFDNCGVAIFGWEACRIAGYTSIYHSTQRLLSQWKSMAKRDEDFSWILQIANDVAGEWDDLNRVEFPDGKLSKLWQRLYKADVAWVNQVLTNIKSWSEVHDRMTLGDYSGALAQVAIGRIECRGKALQAIRDLRKDDPKGGISYSFKLLPKEVSLKSPNGNTVFGGYDKDRISVIATQHIIRDPLYDSDWFYEVTLDLSSSDCAVKNVDEVAHP